MIHLYASLYHYTDYAIKSLASIQRCATEPLKIHVFDVHSKNSERSIEYFSSLVGAGTIDEFFAYEDNVKGFGYLPLLAQCPADRTEDFFVFTDLDVMVDFDWIKETRRLQKDWLITGYPLKLDNYVPPNSGHSEHSFGCWLMGIKKSAWEDFARRKQPFTDAALLSSIGCWAKSDKPLYHLGWDTWKDYPEYWAEKVAGVRYGQPPKSLTYRRWSRV